MATFFYVVIVLNVSTSSGEHNYQTNTALASGLAMAMISACFARVSGGHANPAVTLGMMLAKSVSPLRAILYMCAQCGGGVAGAALVFGVQGRINDPTLSAAGGTFGMEFVLTFLVVYAFCASRDPTSALNLSRYLYSSSPYNRAGGAMGAYGGQNQYGGVGTVGGTGGILGTTQTTQQQAAAAGTTTATGATTATHYSQHQLQPSYVPGNIKMDAVVIGIAYAACLMCWKGSLNPARTLGSAFVSRDENRFEKHWVFWVGPLLGAMVAALGYEYIFNPRRRTFSLRGGIQNQNWSYMDELDMIDDLERARQYKANIMQDFHDTSTTYSGGLAGRMMNPMGGMMGMAGGMMGWKRPGLMGPATGMPGTAMGAESLYGGTKSMYNQPTGMGGMYNGYDPMVGGPGGLRRSRSIHAKLPQAAAGTRRNPYDYLPDEPKTGDLLQSSMVTENGTSRLVPKSASPRYPGDSMDTYGTYDTRTGPAGGTHYAQSNYQRAGSRMRGAGAGGAAGAAGTADQFYSSSSQYNASYSQQNGCSINAANATGPAAAGGATAAGGYSY